MAVWSPLAKDRVSPGADGPRQSGRGSQGYKTGGDPGEESGVEKCAEEQIIGSEVWLEFCQKGTKSYRHWFWLNMSVTMIKSVWNELSANCIMASACDFPSRGTSLKDEQSRNLS